MRYGAAGRYVLFGFVLVAVLLFVYQLDVVDNDVQIRHYSSRPSSTNKSPPKNPSRRNKMKKIKRYRKLPSCLLIGVRKGGTRALIDMLNLHSAVRSASNEVHFFDQDANYERGLDWYRSQMPATSETEMAVEKSPSYFITPSVPGRVHAMNRTVRLLLIVRDPVTRLLSDYTQILQNRRDKGLTLKSFETMVLDPDDGSVNVGYDAVARSLYINHMAAWLDYFPLSQIHVVNGDRLIKKPWHEVARVETFLGLKHEITRRNFYFNSTKGFHCIQRSDDEEERCLAKSKGRTHPNISSTLVHKLRTFFRPYNYRFYDLVGQDFGWPDE